MAQAPPPPKLLRTTTFTPGLYANDVYPDCSIAAIANYATTIAALNGFGLVIDEAKVISIYPKLAGCADTPEAIMASDGLVLLDVLAYVAQTGFNLGNQTLFGVYGQVALTQAALANAMNRLGCVYIGIDIYSEDETTRSWTDAPKGDLVGGHCVNLFDYTGLGMQDTVRVETWGSFYHATWEWLLGGACRLAEAYGLAFRDLTRTSGLEWSGVDYEALRAEVVAGI